MLVFILNKYGKPLMPCKSRKARILLKEKKAKVIKRTPFTIQLLYGSSGYKQETVLGVDAGSQKVGISITTKKQELFSAEFQLRNDIVDLLSTRRENRRTRRNRLRYRKSRFLNRVSTKKEGWLAPSIKAKIDEHLKIVNLVHKILPINKIRVEVASFDMQKIINSDIKGIDYQNGVQKDFWNVREYVLFRDGYKCQGRKNCENKILNVHHIESRKIGGNSPNNLITLCEKCHNDLHAEKLNLNLKRGKVLKDATFMGIMRWAFYNKLKEIYNNVELTFGYITKCLRIENNLPKEHRIDAFCITENIKAKLSNYIFNGKFVRKHNRQIHKANILKGNIKKKNQASYFIFGFKLMDKIKIGNIMGFIFGRRSSGYFDIRKLNGEKLNSSINYKKLSFVERFNSLILEGERCFPPTALAVGFQAMK